MLIHYEKHYCQRADHWFDPIQIWKLKLDSVSNLSQIPPFNLLNIYIISNYICKYISFSTIYARINRMWCDSLGRWERRRQWQGGEGEDVGDDEEEMTIAKKRCTWGIRMTREDGECEICTWDAHCTSHMYKFLSNIIHNYFVILIYIHSALPYLNIS